jgi:hypothetical protein
VSWSFPDVHAGERHHGIEVLPDRPVDCASLQSRLSQCAQRAGFRAQLPLGGIGTSAIGGQRCAWGPFMRLVCGHVGIVNGGRPLGKNRVIVALRTRPSRERSDTTARRRMLSAGAERKDHDE